MNQLTVFRSELDRMVPQFAAALPAHMPPKRFQRVILTAIQNNPDLLRCERQSLWNSAMRAASDGLLPDGREGAIVAFENKAQWLVMIAGLRKKARNSGELSTWDCHAVYANDYFEYELGDNPHIKHKPEIGERGPLIGAYSIAVLKDKSISRDFMSKAEVDKVRSMARAKGGPAWTNHYDEMAKKTVARRHSKVLPLSSDLDEMIRREDSLYELGDAPARPKLADYAGEQPPLDNADAWAMGMEARNAGAPPFPPADLAAELHEAFRAGWQSREDELTEESRRMTSGEDKAAPAFPTDSPNNAG